MKTFPERGDIYLVCLDPTVGSEINKTRPALIVSNDINNQFSGTVTVILLSLNAEKVYPFEAFLSSVDAVLSKKTKARCNRIRTIDKKRLLRRLGSVSPQELKDVEKSVLIHLGMYFDRKQSV
ncbi:type II toxin-antitoxin system PemK/MazF family toxin [bacterium]|nr:type II toxin-antitoxin system PemK/MazF family toxin [bacterium]